ncbi:hypothetical protein Cgig2_011527 [Carnegiea gigantea]|uniref:Kinesin light chain n=1 Tax=Carnegiea gigantea TaxID=171969 RepID=A0A9Q1JH19_9CARY|nr:hypothetical protein Cgig2_011527 [Carnegiea gigantea]
MPVAKIIGGINRSSSLTGTISYFKRSIKQSTSPTSPLSLESVSSGSTSSNDDVDNSVEFFCQNKSLESHGDIKERNKFKSFNDNSILGCGLLHMKEAIIDSKDNVKEVVPLKQRKTVDMKMISGKNKAGMNRKETPSKMMVVVRIKVEGKTHNLSKISQKPPVGKRNLFKKSISSLSGCSPYMGRNSKYQKIVKFEDNGKGATNPDLGPYLLKKARDLISCGDNEKAFELAFRAKKSFEICASNNSNLDYVMCLHVLASMYCCSGQHEEAIALLERSIEIPDIRLSQNHALAKFVSCMRLGDIYAMLGHIEKSLLLYNTGLEVQRAILGEKDSRFGETCRYVAEAYVQAFQFDEAEKLCQLALDIHKANDCPPSIEEAADRRLMGLICESKGKHKNALEHFIIARETICCNGKKVDLSALDCSIGDAYLALAQYEEAILSYNKALDTLKLSKGENHPAMASVFIHLAELHYKVGKFGECKSYCEKALQIYNEPCNGSNIDDIANGLVDLATIYESLNELAHALCLLQKALEMFRDQPDRHCTIAGVEAQMGVIYYMLENFVDSYNSLKRSISKFQASGATKSSLYGITLNQLGLTCIKLHWVSEAVGHFEEARSILEKEYGLCHPDTLEACSNLATAFDDLGRWDDAIGLLEFVVGVREEMLGTADPIVDDEKRRLGRLLRETGRARRRNFRSLETLLDKNSHISNAIIV